MAEAAVLEQIQTQQIYRFVDDLPTIATARLWERQRAELLLEERRAAGENSQTHEFIPVDALSAAVAVLEAEKEFGSDSVEYKESRDGLSLDCQRLLGEWYRKLKPEYFAPIRHLYDRDTGGYLSHGRSTAQLTENAIVPLNEVLEEESHRVNEFIEERTPQFLRSIGTVALGIEKIRTVSECLDVVIERFEEDQAAGRPHQGYLGYVPEIKKLMVRDISLDPRSDDRFEEQVGLPGIYITHEVIQLALERSGVNAAHLNKTELHGSQILARDSLMDFVRLLDDVASEEWCLRRTGHEIFMGELVPADHPRDYEQFKKEALERQESLKDLAGITTEFILDLAREKFDPKKAPGHVEDFVKKLLLDEGKKDFVVAAHMFDEKTAAGLQEVAYLESIGEYDRAYERMQEVEKAAPGGGFCGAGSCGLEGVDINSNEGKQLAEKLNAKAGDKIVKDKERSCRCGSKNVAYAYSKNKVNKYCSGCGAFESKASKAA